MRRSAGGCRLVGATVGLFAWASAGSASAELRVVVTSKPIHALVATVMSGVGTPSVLVSGSASPHTYSMKPSDAQAANRAQVLFRVSAALEPFTVKLIQSLPATVRVVSLIDAPGLDLLDRRETGAFEAHDHGHEHVSGKSDAEDERDPHVWLDPQNAAVIVDHITAVLAEADPASAEMLRRNAAAAKTAIAALSTGLSQTLKPYAGRPFVVLHDAYQYLERRFGLTAVGAIAVNPEAAPSGKRLAAIRAKLRELGPACVFAEPGMQPKIVAAVIEGSSARKGELDPEATRLPAGPDTYAMLMKGLATAFKDCFDRR